MALANITQYNDLAHDANGNIIQAGDEPAIVRENVTFTTATSSSAFDRKTRFVRIIVDADAYIRFGAPTQTAIIGDTRLEANVAEFFGVKPGQEVSILAV